MLVYGEFLFYFTQDDPDDEEIKLDGDIEESVVPFYQVRQFVEKLNSHMLRVVVPGPGIVMDETMIPLQGLSIDEKMDDLPGKICLERKPQGVGIKIKNVADGENKMIFFFELQEGQVPMSTKEYRDRYPSMVALVLCLCKSFARTRRVVYGDAGFASVATLNSLYDELELFFIGNCKQASRMYPKKYMLKWYEALDLKKDVGSHIVLRADQPNKELDMMAVGYADQKIFTFIANVGTTTRTAATQRVYQRASINADSVQKYITKKYIVPRIKIVRQYFEHSGAIDIFNQKVQGVLKPHKHLLTRRW